MRQDREQEAIRLAYRALFDEVWTTVEKQVTESVHLPCKVPSPLRAQFERSFLSQPNIQDYDPRRPSDRRLLATAFRVEALDAAQAVAISFVELVTNLDEATLKRLRRARQPKAREESYKSEAASVENRELLVFVAESIIPLKRMLSGKDTLKPGHHGPDVAVPWDDLRREWNRTHSHQFRSDKAFTRRYYRAVNTSLRRDYLERIAAALRSETLRRFWDLEKVDVEKLPESVFGRLRNSRGGRFPQDAGELSSEAQALRRANEAKGVSAAKRRRNAERAETLEATARSLARVGQVREWLVMGGSALGRYQRQQERADRAIRRRPITVECKGRACNSRSKMRVTVSDEGTTTNKGPLCNDCRVASLILGKLPAANGGSKG